MIFLYMGLRPLRDLPVSHDTRIEKSFFDLCEGVSRIDCDDFDKFQAVGIVGNCHFEGVVLNVCHDVFSGVSAITMCAAWIGY